ncbi:MAG: glycosyltransferase [Candidatus Eisenbacteria bacterium]|uniref:Glycosyltransferase n=1 Tax=Eiseniibacteriota bacterium TaxID=2212470 RepID=A0A948WDY7_UNCEI|nr:glycosyltransferase [Candidatus Eisenbacteria bacterium]MBU1948701.1 glycosyltransferase [Candidatus Eisenbacteria bacterium]MBU2692288.1 glycosyltransferase [Candidatus Eisenbacteria bacterium]
MHKTRSAGPVRILFLAVGMGIGGTERQIYELLRGIPRPLFDPRLGILEEGGALLDRVRSLDLPIVPFKRIGKWDLSAFRLIHRYLKTERIDIIHTFLSPATVFGLGAAALAGNTIRVGSLRSSGTTRTDLRYRLLSGVERWLMRRCDAVVCNSMAGARWGEELGLAPSILHVIYNGIDSSELQTNMEIQSLGIPNDAPVIGMVANFEADKGHAQLIDAAERLISRRPNLTCVFIGDGPARGPLLERVRRQGLSQNILFPGVAYPATPWISRFDVAVLLSQQREGSSNFLVEAMFLGIPVVCSRVGGNAEVVVHDETGIVVDGRDPIEIEQALESLLGDPKRQKRMGDLGRRRAEVMFASAKMVQQHVDLYLQLMRKKDGGK